MYRIEIPYPERNNSFHVTTLKFDGAFKKIIVPNVCVFSLFKKHSHHYDISAFFYETKTIYHRENIGSLKELYHVIQKLLQENLYSAIQKKEKEV